jgi:hypothetical protein
MTKLFSCRYNMDTNRVEARFEDGTTLAIDCIAVEDEYGNTPAQRAELDWLLYNKPLEYAQMVLKGEMEHPLSLGCAHGRLGGLSHRKRAVKSLIARRAFRRAIDDFSFYRISVIFCSFPRKSRVSLRVIIARRAFLSLIFF